MSVLKELKNIKVPKDIWQASKIEAAKQGITLEQYVTQALKAELKKVAELEDKR